MLFTVWFAALSFVASVHAAPYGAACSGVASDSYGRGIEAAFLGGNLRPRLYDEACYQWGVQAGSQTRAQADSAQSCGEDFARGRALGQSTVNQLPGSPACYVAGYRAGQADLDVAAREGDASVAGDDCVRAYRAGQSDRSQNLANDPNAFDDAKSRYCYGLGWYEGPGRY